jgi:hypothetical protein
MKINLSPQRRDDTLQVSRAGATLTVNGELFDFSQMKDGDTLPASAVKCEWFVNQVDCVAGELELTLLLPLPENYSPAQAFPVPLLDVPDGEVQLPQPLPRIESADISAASEQEHGA